MGLFGSVSVDKTKSSGTETGTVSDIMHKLEQTLGTNDTSKTESSATNGTTATQAAGTSASSQASTSGQTSSTTGGSTSTGSSLSDPVRQTLESQFTDLLGSTADQQASQKQRLSSAAAGLSGFNLDDYVKNLVDPQAKNLANNAESARNQLFGSFGGDAAGNTMAALAAGKIADSSAATLATIKGSAISSGEDILMKLQAALGGAGDSITSSQQTLGGLLKGASTSQASTEAQKAASTGTSAGTSNTATTEDQKQQSASTTDLVSAIKELINSTSTGTSDSLQTRNLKTTNDSLAIGAKFGFGK